MRGEIHSTAHPVHIQMLIFDVADQDHAVKAIVLEQQLLVGAERRILVTYGLDTRLGFVNRTGREDVDTHDLELCGRRRTFKYWPAITSDCRRKNATLFEQWRYQSERLSPMLG